MSWRGIARKDVLDAYRTWQLGFAAAFLALVCTFPAFVAASGPAGGGFVGSLGLVLFLVPLVALLLGHDAVAGEREHGSLKLLLGQPYTRLDVVVGTAVGRGAVVTVASLSGVLAAALVFLAFGGALDPLETLAFCALVVLLGAAYSGLAVGVSAASKTTSRAMAACVIAFLATVSWSSIPRLVRYVLAGFSAPSGPSPEWSAVFAALGPVDAYGTLAAGLREGGGTLVRSSDAFYQTRWFALAVLVCWAVVPVALGYRRFEGADL
ncbi:MAG: ABC transporter permease [Halalkalicoccus sp.]|nr:ABC transporter permease [Halalkalicoccus sp.]